MSNVDEWVKTWVSDKLQRNAQLRDWQARAITLLRDQVDPERYGHLTAPEVRREIVKLLEDVK